MESQNRNLLGVPSSLMGLLPYSARRLASSVLRGGAGTPADNTTPTDTADDIEGDYKVAGLSESGSVEEDAMDLDQGNHNGELSDESDTTSSAEDRARRPFSPTDGLIRSPSEDPEGSDVNSNWSKYGDIPDVLDEYDRALELIDGSETWNDEQRKVHQLIYMRGLHPMMPSVWRMGFKMWGIDQPQLNNIFTPTGSRKRVVISSYSDNDVAAVKALESLFTLSQRVHDYDETGQQHLMEPFIVKTLSSYVKWSLQDAKIHKAVPPVILIEAYPPTRTSYDEDVAIAHAGNADETDNAVAEMSEDEDEDEADREETARFIGFLTADLNRKLRAMGRVWRDLLWDPTYKTAGKQAGIGRYIANPPTIYGFAVVQHKVMLVSHDASHIDNPVVSIDQINLNDRGLWLWNALSIAIPINIAKDKTRALQELVLREPLLAGLSAGTDDPDL